MRLSLRPALAILALVALGVTMGVSAGTYQFGALIGVLIALATSLVACVVRDRDLSRLEGHGKYILLFASLFLAGEGLYLGIAQADGSAASVGVLALLAALGVSAGKWPTGSAVEAALSAAAFLLTGNGLFWDQILYCEWPAGQVLYHIAGWVGFVAVLALIPAGAGTRKHAVTILTIVLFAAGALLRLGAVWAAPNPVIDVHAWLRDAPAQLLHGHNPYAAEYESPYETERAEAFGVEEKAEKQPAAYPPLPILLALPLAAAGLDVRYANVACDLLAALMIYLASCRGRARLAALASACYLFLPRTPFMMEEAWFEPMLAAMLGAGLLFVERGWKPGYLFLGLGLTGKQFGLAMLPPLGKSQWRRWPWLLLGLAAAALVMLPFFLWDRASFLSIVLFKHLGRAPVLGSMTMTSAVYHLSGGYLLSRWGTWLIAGVLIGWITWRTPVGRAGAGLWMGTALFVFCLFHTQGHFNYYYLCQYLWLLGIAALLSEGEPGKAPD